MSLQCKVIKEQEIYKGFRVHLFKQTLELPNGLTAEWDLLKHPGASAIVPVDHDGKIILVKQYRNAANDVTLEIPAGVLDEGEEPITAAFRELEEETGHKSTQLDYLIQFYPAIGNCNEIIYVYVAHNLEITQQNLDEDEFVHVEKYSMEEIVDMIFNGKIVDAKSISALLAYKEKYYKN